MKTHTRSSRMRTLGNASYLLGVAFLIAAMAVNAIPARSALAATAGTLNCPLPSYNSTHYALQPGQTVTCTITGASFSGSPTHLTVYIQSSALGNDTVQGSVSGHTITFTYTGRGNGCDTEVVRYSDNNGGKNRPSGVQGFGYVGSNGNPIACGGGTTPTPPADTATPTTPSDTATPTDVVTATPTDVVTATPTDEVTATPTDVVTATPTDEVTATPTTTYQPGPSVTPTDTATVTVTPQPQPHTATPQPHDPHTPLIPVTGAALGGGWSSQTIFFNLGIGFLGLGLVLNGLARSRKELEI